MSFKHATVDSNLSPTARIILGVIGISTTLLLLPFAIFYVYHFHRLRRANVLKKRYVSLGVTSSILMIVWVATATQFYFIQNMFNHLMSPMASTILKALYVFVYPYTSHCAVWLLLTRFWLTYFDFSWTKATLNAEWKVHIDPQGSSHNEQWFLKNKSKYGNLQIVRRKAWIISLCIATVIMVAFELSVFTTLAKATHISALDSIFYIVPAITLLILWRKIPPVYDILFYRQEMKRLGFTVLACVINYFGIIAIGLTLKDDVITTFYSGMSQLVYGYFLIFYQTMWVLYQIKTANMMDIGRTYHRENSHTLQSNSESPQSNGMPSFFRIVSYSIGRKTSRREREKATMLSLILSNKRAFNLFMQHLSAEFSMECLLAFTEFTQYRMMLEGDSKFMAAIHVQNTPAGYDDNTADIELGKVWPDGIQTPKTPKTPTTPSQILRAVTFSGMPDGVSLGSKMGKVHGYKSVKLPKRIPLSYIVYNYPNFKGNEKYLQIARALFQKYVKIGSEFEINVSYGMRHGVQHVMENSDESLNIECDLYDLFESCRKELYALMTHSCQRFVDTEKYKLIENELLTVQK